MRWAFGTLRGRIVVILVGVLVAIAVATDITTTAVLRDFLIGRLDAQLGPAADRFAASLTDPSPDVVRPDPDGDRDATPGQAVGTFSVQLAGSSVLTAQTVDINGTKQPVELDPDDVRRLHDVPADGRDHNLRIDELGSYRVVSGAGPNGQLLITGLPLNPVEDTLGKLVSLETVVMLIALAAGAALTALLVGRTLSPLRRMTRMAKEVSDLPLTEPGVPLPDGLGLDRPTTEVGELSVAFDHMLLHLRSALSDRDDTEVRLRRFIADTSHELRTPLATIQAYTEYAQRDPSGNASDVALDRIHAAAGRMTSLVEDLLLLARLDDGRPLAQEEVDLTQVALEAVMDVRAQAPDHVWHLDLPEESVALVGDTHRLHQLLTNLLVNARNHTPAGTVVGTSVLDRGDQVEVTVIDDGPGIPAAQQSHLFERFTRGDTAVRPVHVSTGLGLAIARGIVDAHGGTLTVESEPGRTAFRVMLPRRRH